MICVVMTRFIADDLDYISIGRDYFLHGCLLGLYQLEKGNIFLVRVFFVIPDAARLNAGKYW